MAEIYRVYTDAVHNNLKPLYANWNPGDAVALGDYGTIDGNCFNRLGNVSQLGIEFSASVAGPTNDQQFSSQDGTKWKAAAAGQADINGVIAVAPKLDIEFGSSQSVFFNTAGCAEIHVEDITALGRAVKQLHDNGQWDYGWTVITQVIKAGATTIAVAGGNNSSITFSATGSSSGINLKDAKLDLAVTSENDVGYKIAAEKGLIPLIQLYKLQGFMWGLFGSDLEILAMAKDVSTPPEDDEV